MNRDTPECTCTTRQAADLDADLPHVSPATGSRRVQATQKRKRPAEDACNLTADLLKRQLGPGTAFGSHRRRCNDAAHAYRHMRLQKQYDGFDPQQPTMLQLQMRRSKVTEIVAAHSMLVVLCHNGSCSAFCRVSGRRLCHLNVRQDEVIRSLFWNKPRRCLVTVSVHSQDHYASLMCRSIPAECLRLGRPQDGMQVFDRLEYPSFIEFDDVNSKVLSYHAADKVYKVFNLQDYRLLYAISATSSLATPVSDGSSQSSPSGAAADISDPNCSDSDSVRGRGMQNSGSRGSSVPSPAEASGAVPVWDAGGAVHEVKISPGVLLLVMEREAASGGSGECVPLRAHSIEDGTLLMDLRHPLVAGHKVDFIELFNQALVVKQEGQPLQIVDVLSAGVDTVAVPDFPTPAAFIFLYERSLFLSLLQHSVAGWNFQGRQVVQFEDHTLLRPNSHISNVYINHAQDTIVSLCQPSGSKAAADGPDCCLGSVHVSSLLSGRCLARLAALPVPHSDADRATRAALLDVTALFLDEEHGDIYTGTGEGLVHRWSA